MISASARAVVGLAVLRLTVGMSSLYPRLDLGLRAWICCTRPLHDRHVALGAKLAEFGGWDMPLEYAGGGVLAEHKAVREAVGLFDVSHLGKALVRGTGAADYVNSCFTNDLDRIVPGKAQYTLCCDEDGGTVDDLIAYLRSDFEVFLIPNAANTAAVVAKLQAEAPDGLEITDLHRDYAILAIQGPLSDEVLQSRSTCPVDHEYMSFADATIAGKDITVCRTGYTGERGYELVVPADDAVDVWDAVIAAGEPYGIRACGLGARDTLRTEMGYPLHGHELSAEISPVMARAGWAVGWKKPTFWGKDALQRQREEKTVRTLARTARSGARHPASRHDGARRVRGPSSARSRRARSRPPCGRALRLPCSSRRSRMAQRSRSTYADARSCSR